jgi:hypothetical protein
VGDHRVGRSAFYDFDYRSTRDVAIDNIRRSKTGRGCEMNRRLRQTNGKTSQAKPVVLLAADACRRTGCGSVTFAVLKLRDQHPDRDFVVIGDRGLVGRVAGQWWSYGWTSRFRIVNDVRTYRHFRRLLLGRMVDGLPTAVALYEAAHSLAIVHCDRRRGIYWWLKPIGSGLFQCIPSVIAGFVSWLIPIG